jgi:hypothetical protein
MTSSSFNDKAVVSDHGQDFWIAHRPPGGTIDPDNGCTAGAASPFFHLFASLFF